MNRPGDVASPHPRGRRPDGHWCSPARQAHSPWPRRAPRRGRIETAFLHDLLSMTMGAVLENSYSLLAHAARSALVRLTQPSGRTVLERTTAVQRREQWIIQRFHQLIDLQVLQTLQRESRLMLASSRSSSTPCRTVETIVENLRCASRSWRAVCSSQVACRSRSPHYECAGETGVGNTAFDRYTIPADGYIHHIRTRSRMQRCRP